MVMAAPRKQRTGPGPRRMDDTRAVPSTLESGRDEVLCFLRQLSQVVQKEGRNSQMQIFLWAIYPWICCNFYYNILLKFRDKTTKEVSALWPAHETPKDSIMMLFIRCTWKGDLLRTPSRTPVHKNHFLNPCLHVQDFAMFFSQIPKDWS